MAGRVRAGSELAAKSWRIVRQERWTVWTMLATAIGATVVALGAFVLVWHRLPNGSDGRFPHYLLVVPFLWVVSFFCNCSACLVTIVVDARLRGEPISRGDAFRRLESKLGRILIWTLVAGIVGMVLSVIAERLKLGGRLVQTLLGLSWALATTFVIQVLVVEDVSVRQSIRRSASVFRGTWAQKVTADATVGLFLLMATIPALLLAAALALIAVPLAIVAGALIIAVFLGLSAALETVLDVATYRPRSGFRP